MVMQGLSSQVIQCADDTKPADAVRCSWVACSQQSRELMHENLPREEGLLHLLRHLALVEAKP